MTSQSPKEVNNPPTMENTAHESTSTPSGTTAAAPQRENMDTAQDIVLSARSAYRVGDLPDTVATSTKEGDVELARSGDLEKFQESKIKEDQVESSSKEKVDDNKGQGKEFKNENQGRYVADGDLETWANLPRDEAVKAVRSMMQHTEAGDKTAIKQLAKFEDDAVKAYIKAEKAKDKLAALKREAAALEKETITLNEESSTLEKEIRTIAETELEKAETFCQHLIASRNWVDKRIEELEDMIKELKDFI
jgi:hypothetical protein